MCSVSQQYEEIECRLKLFIIIFQKLEFEQLNIKIVCLTYIRTTMQIILA